MGSHLYSSMSEAVNDLRRRGFTADFTFSPGPTETISTAGRSFKGEDLKIVEHHRFEGVSDPDDSSVLYALDADGIKGLLIDAYGAYADSGIGAVLKRARDDHEEAA